jgi:hypothetical protein
LALESSPIVIWKDVDEKVVFTLAAAAQSDVWIIRVSKISWVLLSRVFLYKKSACLALVEVLVNEA